MKRFKVKIILTIIFLGFMALISRASNDSYFVNDLALDATNKPSLQRGAQLYFNYCSSCHSLRYEHYSKLGHTIGAEDPAHQLYADLIQKSLLFDLHGDIHAYIESHMQPEDAKKWFGVVPPDLTNITATKSPAWVYNFLRAFYRDDSKPFGSNNLMTPNTAMPNVLQPLRGETLVVWNNQHFDHFVTTKPGELKPLEFDHAIYDLVNFLNIISEPQQMLRIWIGICILAFLAILLLMIYFWIKSTQPEPKDSEPN